MLSCEFQSESRVRKKLTHGLLSEVKLIRVRKRKLPVHRVFTLIELLLVVAVIAILAGMLLPALNKAREKGKAISCVNNMKTLGMCYIMYQNDFNNWCGGTYGYNFSNSPSGYNMWFEYFHDTYVKNKETFHCPSEPVFEFHYSTINYGLNYTTFGANIFPSSGFHISKSTQISRFHRNTKLAVFLDSPPRGSAHPWVPIDTSYTVSCDYQMFPFGSGERAPVARHNNGLGVAAAMFDGHAAIIQLNDFYAEGAMTYWTPYLVGGILKK